MNAGEIQAMNETLASCDAGLAPEASVALRYTRRIEDLPSPRGQPVVGNALQLSGRQMHQKFTEWVGEYGPMFRLQVFVFQESKILKMILH